MSHAGNVCIRCASIKQRCGGGLPCGRCERLDIACTYRDGPSIAPKNPARVQPRLTRVRTGCTNCKARKKKCDETRPKCHDCTRLNMSCQWPEASPPRESCSPPAHEQSARVDAGDVSLQEFRNDTPVTEDSTPTYEDGTIETLGLGTHLDVGCPENVLSLLPDLNETDKSLLNHYIKAVADVFNRSSGDSSNPFLERLLPVAYSSNITLSALLSLSGVHWRRVHPKAYTRSLVHQGKAISGLTSVLGRSNYVAQVQATTTVLLLCLGELADGRSTAWQWHLNAAERLLESKIIRESKTSQTVFLKSLFHYLDAITTISSCKKPLLQPVVDQGTAENSDLTQLSTTTDVSLEAIYGVPRSLFNFVGRMNSLAQRRSTRTDPGMNASFEADAILLELDLDCWRFMYDQMATTGLASGNRKTRSASEALEWAIRLRLYQIVYGYDNTNLFPQQAISRILEAIATIRNGSRVEGCLLFPLVIAGASTHSEEQRAIVKQRLMVMENTLGFGHITAALELVEKVWQARETQTSRDVNWASVRYHEFPGIAFL